MPVKMRKLRNKNKWRVYDANGKIHAFGTTKKKAQAQVRLINSLRK